MSRRGVEASKQDLMVWRLGCRSRRETLVPKQAGVSGAEAGGSVGGGANEEEWRRRTSQILEGRYTNPLKTTQLGMSFVVEYQEGPRSSGIRRQRCSYVNPLYGEW